MKRVEVFAIVLAGMFIVYLVGYHDGANTRHRTTSAEVLP